MITDADMVAQGFVKLPDGSWLPPEFKTSPEEALWLYNYWLKAEGQSLDTGRRNPHSRSIDDGIL